VILPARCPSRVMPIRRPRFLAAVARRASPYSPNRRASPARTSETVRSR
jgi:hypothetical protein